ncbi:hypothetical protein CSW57_11550 [Williamsia muralis]|uniref:Uncharacterized protein n=2 Tax=Williamsia marianensis TaxID=85044 RepID=A0A2G3PM68_WILMA|nr:hypothetical protein CSW57_11550 [Williamsia marianensis]
MISGLEDSMPKHRVMRPTTVWFSVLVASLGLVVGGILLALTSPSAAADPEVPSEVTVTSRPGSDSTSPTNSGNGNADHTPGMKSTETSRVPARSATGPTPDLGQGDGNSGNGNNGNGNGNTGIPGNNGNTGSDDDGLPTVPTAEVPGIELPAITIPNLPIPGLPIPGMPTPDASTPPPPGSPTPGYPTPGSPAPSTGTPELTPGDSEQAVPQGDPLSDPSTPPAATPTASSCLMGAGTGGGCAGAEVARDLSPAGLLVLGSVALFGSGAFLESLRNGRG